jgi:hypothetical protein
MLCDYANEIAEEGFPCPLGQMMFLGQGRGKMFARNRTVGFGCSARVFCDSAMMDSLLRARNALQNQGSDSATKEKWFEGKKVF